MSHLVTAPVNVIYLAWKIVLKDFYWEPKHINTAFCGVNIASFEIYAV